MVEIGLKINMNKTKYMVTSGGEAERRPPQNFLIRENVFNGINRYSYS